MKAWEIADLIEQRRQSGERYLEFLRVPSLNAGVYVLAAGGVDPQQPHDEDEVYYVLSGRGRFMADGEDVPVQAGTVLFVEKHVEHRFHTIEEELTILVFFASEFKG